MIRIKVELDQYGQGRNITPLAEVHISNQGGRPYGSPRGDYDVVSLRKGTQTVQRRGHIENFPRKSKPVLSLVKEALEQMGY